MRRIYTKKYTDFVESEPIERRGKLPPHEPTMYVDVTCPHCQKVCAEIPHSLLKQTKATNCLAHLRVCPEYTGEVKEKVKRGPTNAELLEKLKSMEENNEALQKRMHEESQAERATFHRSIVGTMERVSHELGLDPPPPKSEEELLDKIKENRKKRALDQQREQDELDEERDGRNSGVDLTKCLICTKRRRKVLHYPCNHISTCATCAEQWKQQCLEKNVDHTCIQCRIKVKRCLVGIF